VARTTRNQLTENMAPTQKQPLRVAQKRRRLYVFDLDETLWDGSKLYDEVAEMLQGLREAGHFVYIATFNTRGPEVLARLGIAKWFHGGAFGRDASKLTMVQQCMHHVRTVHGYTPLHVEFFDDQMTNISGVHRGTGGRVRAVHIVAGLKRRHLDSDEPLLIAHDDDHLEFTTGYYY
jgi:predicted phosphatase